MLKRIVVSRIWNQSRRVLSLGFILFLGCQTTSLSSRLAARRAAFDSLSPSEQSLVLRHEIAKGMDTNAVWIAWGPPSRVEGNPPNRLVWVYLGSYVVQQPYWSWESNAYGDGHGTYEPRVHHVSLPYVQAEVIFGNNSVTELRTFPKPQR